MTGWRKSTWSKNYGDCVEVRARRRRVQVRDTAQQGAGPVLTVTAGAWRALLAEVRAR